MPNERVRSHLLRPLILHALSIVPDYVKLRRVVDLVICIKLLRALRGDLLGSRESNQSLRWLKQGHLVVMIQHSMHYLRVCRLRYLRKLIQG
jgi:hypothetical protein